MYTTDNGQVIYTTQPPPNATATIPTNMPITQGTQLITSPSGNIQLASPQQIQSQQVQQQPDVSIQGSNANRVGARGAGAARGGRQAANNRGTKRKNPSSSQTQNNNQINNTNLANNNRTTAGGVLSAGDDDASVLAESVDDLPCAPDDEDIHSFGSAFGVLWLDKWFSKSLQDDKLGDFFKKVSDVLIAAKIAKFITC